MKTSKRIDSLAPFMAMDVARKAREYAEAGKDIVDMSVGEPTATAAKSVVAKAKNLLDDGITKYTNAAGVGALRERVARYYADKHGLQINPARIFITTGSSSGFVYSFLASFEKDQKVGVLQPGYPAYPNILKGLGIEPVYIPTLPENNFEPTAAQIAEHDDLDGLIIASPSNPTGTVINNDEFKKIIDVCADKNIRFISDEIYHGITYDVTPDTALKHSDDVIIINSFSKYYCMTGWRLGWLVLPEDLIRPVEVVAQSFMISPPTVAQHAAVTAFDCSEELDQIVDQYRENRDLLVNGLKELNFGKFHTPEGGFFLYVDISDYADDSMTFCQTLLDEISVAITPGLDFDPVRGHKYLRISYASPHEDVQKFLHRLKGWLKV